MSRPAYYYSLWLSFSLGLTFTLPFMLRNDYGRRNIQDSIETGKQAMVPGDESRETGASRVFRVSAYCACRECCGDWSKTTVESGRRRTASGRILRRSDTRKIVAASDAYEFGTRIQFEDLGIVTVQDRGRLITGNRLDLYCGSDPGAHQRARDFGVQTKRGRILK